jgi:uncharacterized protein YdaU (DUF1376 family)
VKSDTWMPFYIGDYLADTMHLNAEEHGAYILLLMHQWRNGLLPDDDYALSAIARVSTKNWCRYVGPKLRVFFTIVPGGYLSQKRLAEEREKVMQVSEKRGKAGKLGGEAKARNGGNGSTNGSEEASKEDSKPLANAKQNASKTVANGYQNPRQLQSHLPKEEERKKESRSLRSLDQIPENRDKISKNGFDAWWTEYPRKVGKGRAEKAYAKAVTAGASEGDLLIAVRRQSWPSDPQFTPHPATWLNDRRWLDDPDAATKSAPVGKMDWVKDYAERNGIRMPTWSDLEKPH